MQFHSTLSLPDQAIVLSLYASGKSALSISQELGLPYKRVYRLIRASEIHRPQGTGAVDRKSVCASYEQGLSIAKVARQHGITGTYATAILKEAGIYRPSAQGEHGFWSRMSKGDRCWEWQGKTRPDGYGILSFRGRPYQRAHRVAYELIYGPIPDGLHVCHHCDNPPCCRPDHLFLGPPAANLADMRSKDRSCYGDRCPWSKLNSLQAAEIRRRRANGESLNSLAEEFDISRSLIQHIAKGTAWRRAG